MGLYILLEVSELKESWRREKAEVANMPNQGMDERVEFAGGNYFSYPMHQWQDGDIYLLFETWG